MISDDKQNHDSAWHSVGKMDVVLVFSAWGLLRLDQTDQAGETQEPLKEEELLEFQEPKRKKTQKTEKSLGCSLKRSSNLQLGNIMELTISYYALTG